MRATRLILAQLSAKARDDALAAAREAFPAAKVVEVATAEEAICIAEANYLELLVLSISDSAALAQAIQAGNRDGVPRWAVVNLGSATADSSETVPSEDWDPRLLTRVFRSALRQHELRCENHRLRGDLKTVARRFSHDLTTPVACVSTSAGVLRMLPADDAPAIAAIIQNIDDSSAEISGLIERVCFVLRASADPLASVKVEMSEVVAAVLNQLEAAVRKAKATVTLPLSWPKATGVTKWLEVIWTNLLNNALRYGGPAARIRIAWKLDGDEYRFCVYDNGSGVSPKMKASLFLPFEQLHSQHTAGLGLSIVQRLISLQGGRCGYEQTPGGETCFYFTLSASSPQSPRDAGLSG